MEREYPEIGHHHRRHGQGEQGLSEPADAGPFHGNDQGERQQQQKIAPQRRMIIAQEKLIAEGFFQQFACLEIRRRLLRGFEPREQCFTKGCGEAMVIGQFHVADKPLAGNDALGSEEGGIGSFRLPEDKRQERGKPVPPDTNTRISKRRGQRLLLKREVKYQASVIGKAMSKTKAMLQLAPPSRPKIRPSRAAP